jgi:hypothetical protein
MGQGREVIHVYNIVRASMNGAPDEPLRADVVSTHINPKFNDRAEKSATLAFEAACQEFRRATIGTDYELLEEHDYSRSDMTGHYMRLEADPKAPSTMMRLQFTLRHRNGELRHVTFQLVQSCIA